MSERTMKVGTFMPDGYGRPLKMLVTVTLADGRLSITGECYNAQLSRPPQRGYYSGGQNIDDLRAVTWPAEGWTLAELARLAEVWDRWHLNDMRAGCEHQRALGWQACPGHYGSPGQRCSQPTEPEPATPEDLEQARCDLAHDGVALVGRGSYYRCADDKLSQPCPECGYRFGSAWLTEELPDDIRAYAQQLIDTGRP